MVANIMDKVVVILTNYIIYLLTHPTYSGQLLHVGFELGESLVKDVFATKNPYPEAFNWSIQQQVENRGYLFEEHKIHTEDGYILTAWRIPGRKDEPPKQGKQPVIMQHGLLDDGGTWLFNNANMDLSLELVDMGNDIWIPNNRGTVYSNEHETYTIKDAAFWNFTLHEMGQYDVPGSLKYILNKTSSE